MTRLDSANVNAIDDMFIQHARNCAVHTNLADGAGTFGLIFQCIRFEGQDHDLVADTAVVNLATPIFSKVVFVNEHLLFVLQILQIDSNRNRQKHVSLKCWASGGCAMGLVNAWSISVK